MTARVYSSSAKGSDYFEKLLLDAEFQLVEDGVPDLCVVDTPLHDELGTSFAVACARQSITIAVVKKERFEQLQAMLEPHNIIVIAKPLNSLAFGYILQTLKVTRNRITELETKLDDAKLINRAKLTLITNLKMSEPQAHKYLEQQSMERREPKRQVALSILKTYSNSEFLKL